MQDNKVDDTTLLTDIGLNDVPEHWSSGRYVVSKDMMMMRRWCKYDVPHQGWVAAKPHVQYRSDAPGLRSLTIMLFIGLCGTGGTIGCALSAICTHV